MRELESFKKVYRYNKESKIKYWFFGTITILIIFMFLPWTQNIKSKEKKKMHLEKMKKNSKKKTLNKRNG